MVMISPTQINVCFKRVYEKINNYEMAYKAI